MYTDKEKQVYDWIYSIGWLVFFVGAIVLSGVLGK